LHFLSNVSHDYYSIHDVIVAILCSYLHGRLIIIYLIDSSSEDSENALVQQLSRHKGPVSFLFCLGDVISSRIYSPLHLNNHYWKCCASYLFFQVRGLEFSSLSPNHLASGAEGGEICIWDFAKPTEPTHFPPLKVTITLLHLHKLNFEISFICQFLVGFYMCKMQSYIKRGKRSKIFHWTYFIFSIPSIPLGLWCFCHSTWFFL